MKKELIADLFGKFESACYIYEGIECWSAREMQEIFGYTQWRNFLNAVDKAKEAAANAGEKVSDHLADISKMVDVGSGANRPAWIFSLCTRIIIILRRYLSATGPLF